ncbi:hypothetical protein AT1G67148 [Arabidopsis thaliana]|uniref:Uncharacterized protein n=1 Tax=Arabidopsis thaliana TaxID=3702 RepID=Q0WR90_ARATH|nr:uncharacterized protein AT1G67148 [Arabidopsis thaliana]AEE34603.1 hypothetical protein AT1G67148 [Arabidopsis thaliana]BAF00359.1 hypothetical protein [Arabidopsis thaliana]|eukprot:NP_001077780.1 hypothetical protein AT1G67148 [Arabidopsis thaliana]
MDSSPVQPGPVHGQDDKPKTINTSNIKGANIKTSNIKGTQDKGTK